MFETCHTFATEAEAVAFIHGFDLAVAAMQGLHGDGCGDPMIHIGLDEEERNCVLIDVPEDSDGQMDAYWGFAATVRIPPPEQVMPF